MVDSLSYPILCCVIVNNTTTSKLSLWEISKEMNRCVLFKFPAPSPKPTSCPPLLFGKVTSKNQCPLTVLSWLENNIRFHPDVPSRQSLWVSNSVFPPAKTGYKSGTFGYLCQGWKPLKMDLVSCTQSQMYNFTESKNSRKSSERVQSDKNMSCAHSIEKSPKSMPLHRRKRCFLSYSCDDYKYTYFISVWGHLAWDSACHIGSISLEHVLCISFCSGFPEVSAACLQVS